MSRKIAETSFVLICLLFLASTQAAYAGCSDKRSPGMDWSGCKKTNKMLDDTNFTGSRFDSTNLMMSILDESNFTDASMVKADMTRVKARESRFIGADLTKVVGYRAKLDKSIFNGTQMTKSEFSRASFRDAEILDVDWSKSELGRANFTNALLSNVSFVFTNLSRVIFSGSKLSDIDFHGAYTYQTHLEDTDLSRVKRLTQAQVDIACGNDNTRLPDGLNKPQHWPCSE